MYGPNNAAAKAIDGVLGYGINAVSVGGAAGESEWVAKGETVGAWIRVDLKTPTAVGRVILYNRQVAGIRPCETFAAGHLDFSDGSRVEARFGPGPGSRAVVPFASRTVSWVKFTGDKMQGEGKGNAGLAEFEIHPSAEPYLKHTHGMTDVNFALVGYGVADNAQAKSVWRYFKAHEEAFYIRKGVACPTWTAELPETYAADELNSINPDKDRTAFGRMWRHNVWMRSACATATASTRPSAMRTRCITVRQAAGPAFSASVMISAFSPRATTPRTRPPNMRSIRRNTTPRRSARPCWGFPRMFRERL